MNNQKTCTAIELVERISLSLQTISWLWGGLVADVYTGGFLREHDDLDYLTLNLHQLKQQISEIFGVLGWHSKHLENGDLKLTKDDVKIHLGHVELSREATWTHNGEKGSLVFPVAWLPVEAIDFIGMKVHAVSPELQYVLKQNPNMLNQGWTPREKDMLDLQHLEGILSLRNVKVFSLRELVTDV